MKARSYGRECELNSTINNHIIRKSIKGLLWEKSLKPLDKCPIAIKKINKKFHLYLSIDRIQSNGYYLVCQTFVRKKSI